MKNATQNKVKTKTIFLKIHFIILCHQNKNPLPALHPVHHGWECEARFVPEARAFAQVHCPGLSSSSWPKALLSAFLYSQELRGSLCGLL